MIAGARSVGGGKRGLVAGCAIGLGYDVKERVWMSWRPRRSRKAFVGIATTCEAQVAGGADMDGGEGGRKESWKRKR